MTRIIACLLVCATFLVAALPASSAPITVPTDLNPGDQYRLAFVTSTRRDATSTNIADYNAFVTGLANSVPELLALGTNWTAIASTETVDARDNTGTNPTVSTGVPVYRLDDTRIANNNTDLWDAAIAAPLTVTEAGLPATGDFLVWTGTDTSGLADFPLGIANFGSRIGSRFDADSKWISITTGDKTLPFQLYAISAPLAVVPEPSALALAAFGFVALTVLRWRRRCA